MTVLGIPVDRQFVAKVVVVILISASLYCLRRGVRLTYQASEVQPNPWANSCEPGDPQLSQMFWTGATVAAMADAGQLNVRATFWLKWSGYLAAASAFVGLLG